VGTSEEWEPTEADSIKREWMQENHEVLESMRAYRGEPESTESHHPVQVHRSKGHPVGVMKRVGKQVVSASANVKARVRAVLGNVDINKFVGHR
jgi:hypothetical protein